MAADQNTIAADESDAYLSERLVQMAAKRQNGAPYVSHAGFRRHVMKESGSHESAHGSCNHDRNFSKSEQHKSGQCEPIG